MKLFSLFNKFKHEHQFKFKVIFYECRCGKIKPCAHQFTIDTIIGRQCDMCFYIDSNNNLLS